MPLWVWPAWSRSGNSGSAFTGEVALSRRSRLLSTALTLVLLLLAPSGLVAQPIQDMGEETPSTAQAKKQAKKDSADRGSKANTAPAVGGRVLSECSAQDATERLTTALGAIRALKKLRVVPGRSVQVEYRGREVNLDVTAHGSCQSSFQATLPYLGRPGEEAAIRRAYSAVMEPAVAALAQCDPSDCLEEAARAEETQRELAARQEAAAIVEAAPDKAGGTSLGPTSAGKSAHNTAALAYLKALSADEAYARATSIVREALPTPLTAQFPAANQADISITLLEAAPEEFNGGAELEALRQNLNGVALSSELQERFRAVLGEVEAHIAGPCYRVVGYVDFQNRCGALVRGRYESYVSKREGTGWFAVGKPSIDFPDCPGR